jgi:hypothetical protein
MAYKYNTMGVDTISVVEAQHVTLSTPRIRAMSDAELIAEYAAALRIKWQQIAAGQHTTATPEADFYEEYTRRKQQNPALPPVPEPTDIPVYNKAKLAQSLQRWAEANGWIGRIYGSWVVEANRRISGVDAEGGKPRPMQWPEIAQLSSPFIGAYLGNRYGHGQARWMVAGALAGPPVGMVLFYAWFYGMMFAHR